MKVEWRISLLTYSWILIPTSCTVLRGVSRSLSPALHTTQGGSLHCQDLLVRCSHQWLAVHSRIQGASEETKRSHPLPELKYRSVLSALAVGQNSATEPEVKGQQFERSKYQIGFSSPATGEGVLSAYIDGRKSGVVPVQIDLDKEKGKASITFEDRTKDIYSLYVYWDNRLIREAPFKLNLSELHNTSTLFCIV